MFLANNITYCYNFDTSFASIIADDKIYVILYVSSSQPVLSQPRDRDIKSDSEWVKLAFVNKSERSLFNLMDKLDLFFFFK